MIQLEDTIIDIIKKARDGLGLSLRALADQTGIPVAEIQKVEKGETPPQEKLLAALRVSFAKLNMPKDAIAPKTIPEKIEGGMTLKTFTVEIGGVQSQCYILAHGHYALLVDSTGASPDAMKYLKTEGFEPLFLLITHGHFDHIAGIEKIKAAYQDIRVIFAGKDVLCDSVYEGVGFRVEAVGTAGHTEDAICYLVNNVIAFVGDTIFARSIGRPNYSLDLLIKNIREKIFTWNDEIILAPGHGPLTTVGEEKKYNPFF